MPSPEATRRPIVRGKAVASPTVMAASGNEQPACRGPDADCYTPQAKLPASPVATGMMLPLRCMALVTKTET